MNSFVSYGLPLSSISSPIILVYSISSNFSIILVLYQSVTASHNYGRRNSIHNYGIIDRQIILSY